MTEPLSRRDFLKLSAAALAGLAFRPQIKKLENASKEVQLDELGLGDYQEVYREGLKLKDSFGVSPPILNEVWQILDSAASNNLDQDDEHVRLLRDGWGIDEERKITDADKHVNEIKIEIDSTQVKDSEKDVRDFLFLAAKSYPIHILGLPNKVVIVPRGGLSAGTYITFTTRLDPEQSAVSFIHEATHELDNRSWKDVKQYVDKKKFANYVATYYRCINDFAQNYLRMTEDQVAENSVAGVYGLDGGLKDPNYVLAITDKLNEFTQRFDIREISVPTNDHEIGKAWNVFLYRLGNKLLLTGIEFSTDEKTLQEMRQIFQYGFNLPDYNLNCEGLLNGIGHFLVGPVQSSNYGLPSQEGQFDSNFMMQDNLLLQRTRFNSFSTLPYNATFSEVRESFGLPIDRPEEQKIKDLQKMLITGVCTAIGTNITFNKVAKVITDSRQRTKEMKESLEQFDYGVKESVKVDLSQLIDDKRKVINNLPDGSELLLSEISKNDHLLMHLTEPTFLVLTDDKGNDSIIAFPSLSNSRFDYYSPDSGPMHQVGLLIFGPLFNQDDSKVEVATALNKNYFRGDPITYSNPEGVPWDIKNGELKINIKNKSRSVMLPWYKGSNILKARVGRVKNKTEF